jgi:NRAMP (natural resistance-associated macrophage protein)-like metal ion transporter
VITVIVGAIALCYLVETWLDRPNWGQIFARAILPQFAGGESVLLSAGILGATVMPHVIFLHSALTQARNCRAGRSASAPIVSIRDSGRDDRPGAGGTCQRRNAGNGCGRF